MNLAFAVVKRPSDNSLLVSRTAAALGRWETLDFLARGDMQKEFEEAAFKLKPGEVSNVVETASGLHLIERSVYRLFTTVLN